MGLVYKILNVTVPHYAQMEQLFRAGRSANAVQQLMAGLGRGYRRSTVQAVRRDVLGLVQKEERVQALPKTARPNKSQIHEDGWNQPYPYKIFGTVIRTNIVTGQEQEVNFSFYLTSLSTKQGMESEAYQRLAAQPYLTEYKYGELKSKQILHKRGAAW